MIRSDLFPLSERRPRNRKEGLLTNELEGKEKALDWSFSLQIIKASTLLASASSAAPVRPASDLLVVPKLL